MTDAYRRTRVRDGVTLNYRTLEMLTIVDRALSFPIVLTQGSYTSATPQSGGTHDGGGAMDIRAITLTSAQRKTVETELRRVGFAAWIRDPSQGDWPWHIHAIAVGDKELSDAAKAQVVAYNNNRNGLKNNGPDTGTRLFVGTVHQQELDMSFYGPEHWDDADFERFFNAAGWGKNVKDLVNERERDSGTLLSFIHKNGAEAETAAKAALAAGEDASGKAEQVSAKVDEVLELLRPPV